MNNIQINPEELQNNSNLELEKEEELENKNEFEKERETQEEVKNFLPIPKFFSQEKNILVAKTFFSTLFVLIAIACAIVFYFFYKNHDTKPWLHWFNLYYFAIPCIVFLIFFILMLVQSIRLLFLRKEIQRVEQYFNPSQVSTFVQKLYARISVSFSNINWLCVYLYLTGLFILLVVFIVNYFYGIWIFGGLKAPKFATLIWNSNLVNEIASTNIYFDKVKIFSNLNLITVISVCSVFGLVLIYQISSQVANAFRLNRIEYSYNVPIIEIEALDKIKRSVNKRNFIIFAVLSIIFCAVLLMLFFLLKKKKPL